MSPEVTGIDPEEVLDFVRAGEVPFGAHAQDVDHELWASFIEPDRAFAVRESGRIVGTAANLSMELSVPGGRRVAMAGVTSVGVWPSHRRQGHGTQLLRALHDDARERGDAVAGLWASESSIYGRWGYGPAAWLANREIATVHAAFRVPLEVAGRVRLVEPEEGAALLAALHRREQTRTPGLPTRDAKRLRAGFLQDPPHWRGGAGPRFFAAVDERAVAVYRITEGWSGGLSESRAGVEELYADDDESYALLWRYLLDLDLVTRVVARGRPLDEPLPHLLEDPRRVETRVGDSLWLRVLDVPALLEGRAYACAGTVTIQVHDPGGYADGCWTLDVDGAPEPDEQDDAGDESRARCLPAATPPDVTVPVSTLGAVCLGGTSLRTLARAGQVTEHRPGSLHRLGLMLSSDVAPWCPFEF